MNVDGDSSRSYNDQLFISSFVLSCPNIEFFFLILDYQI